MGKNANELALRDPAAAALLGVIGSDFGDESTVPNAIAMLRLCGE